MTAAQIPCPSEPLDWQANPLRAAVEQAQLASTLPVREIRCTICHRVFEHCPDATPGQQWAAHHRQTGHDGAWWHFGQPL